jgi:hypothetical protein
MDAEPLRRIERMKSKVDEIPELLEEVNKGRNQRTR